MSAPDLATQRQITAADPFASTWLSANAGSGKTRVLIDRVARLLLEQVPPQNILCVTYTKAAASEMQNRLFARLGGWAMSPDDTLRAALAGLGVPGPVTDDRLLAARRLFARAIETPGGLRIQTIHAFCAALLRRFPLEAGVSPGFRELDDRSLAEMVGDVVEDMAAGPDTSALDGLARYLSTDDLVELARTLLSRREEFAKPLSKNDILVRLGMPANLGDGDLARDVFQGGEAALLDKLLPLLDAGSTTDQKAAPVIRQARAAIPSIEALPMLEDVLLRKSGGKAPFSAKIGSFPTKATRARLDPAAQDALDALMARVETARTRRLAIAAAERSAALHAFAATFLPAMQARKDEGGWLDFDDLILGARALLTDPAVSDWVLFKLDGNIDHMLIDEAQDTSPAQWQVIQSLARELTVGASARSDVPRTLFVVGDRKQSIYSFQGADPEAFDLLRHNFDRALSAAGTGVRSATLEHSFRSAPAILELVDRVFSGDGAHGLGGPPKHTAFHGQAPGRVDLWPVVEAPEKPLDTPWYEPVDKTNPRGAEAVLADEIAKEIARLIHTGETIPATDGTRRPLAAGDILILVQRRGTLFKELISACKRHNLPLAGADRLVVTRELAVKDILALLSFLSLPEDDLSLAAALRSPVFGWSEDDLFRLAHGRDGHLWARLRGSDHPGHAATLEVLHDLRSRTDFLRPFDLIQRILIRHGGRETLVARLGDDCEEALDALLGAALEYEQVDVPSLTGFLEWMRADAAEIKRQQEAAGTRLRIMTIHGAKGLEAPLVILPDCAQRQPPQVGSVVRCEPEAGEHWSAWKPTANEMPDALALARDDWKSRQEDERKRLLYVALTRAASWLWVCAAGKTRGSWHERVADALSECDAVSWEFPTGGGLRLASGDWSGLPLVEPETELPSDPAPVPDWVYRMASKLPEDPAPLAPSGLGGAKVVSGDAGLAEAQALLWGDALHRLLEALPDFPEASWTALAPNLVGPEFDDVDGVLAEATAVLTNPDLGFLFADGTLAEVPLTATSRLLRRSVYGVVDRLLVEPARVLAVDFKSNAVVPESSAEVPEGLLRQMGAYAEALAQIYTDRPIETAILWTKPARMMPLPAALTAAALARAEADTSASTAP